MIWPDATSRLFGKYSLTNNIDDAQGALIKMIERGMLQILPLETDDLPPIRSLMRRYADLPMDFADATLVQVAKRLGIDRIFTLDRRDFAVYRLPRGRAFTLIPDKF